MKEDNKIETMVKINPLAIASALKSWAQDNQDNQSTLPVSVVTAIHKSTGIWIASQSDMQQALMDKLEAEVKICGDRIDKENKELADWKELQDCPDKEKEEQK